MVGIECDRLMSDVSGLRRLPVAGQEPAEDDEDAGSLAQGCGGSCASKQGDERSRGQVCSLSDEQEQAVRAARALHRDDERG